MVQPWDRKRVGDAATTTSSAERKGAPPSRTPSAPTTRWAKMGVEEKRESAPEEAMEEEWALGQIVWKVGGQDGSWLFLFPLFGCGFLLVFLTGGWGPDYDRLGRSGARETDI